MFQQWYRENRFEDAIVKGLIMDADKSIVREIVQQRFRYRSMTDAELDESIKGLSESQANELTEQLTEYFSKFLFMTTITVQLFNTVYDSLSPANRTKFWTGLPAYIRDKIKTKDYTIWKLFEDQGGK